MAAGSLLTPGVANADWSSAINAIGKGINGYYKILNGLEKLKADKMSKTYDKDFRYVEKVNAAIGKDKAEKLSLLTEAIKIDPKRYEAYYRRSFAQLWGSKEAIADLDKAIQLKPNDAEIYYMRGLHYRMANDNAAALKDYKAALKIDPKYMNAYKALKNDSFLNTLLYIALQIFLIVFISPYFPK